MAVNYDDVIRRNKRNLTRAQIRALSKAANRFSAENAGNRAGALSQLKEQYDTGYRRLQNMGLAGGVSAQATSGEVPRLGGKIETAFDQYNQKLNDVEHQRLKALGGAYAKATRRARYEAYKKRLAAEAARRAALEAAMRQKKEEQEKSASMHQTPVEARGLSGSTITSDIRRQRNVNMTDTGTGDSGKQQAPVYTSKKEAIAAAAKAQKEAQERREAAYGASDDYQRREQMALRRYQNAADRAAREKQHAYDVAAAELVGVSMPKQPENVQTAATNLKAAEARAPQDNGDMTGRVKGPSFKTQSQLDARQEVKNAEETLRQSKVVGYDTVADKQAYEAAQKKFEQAEMAYNSAGKSPVAKPGQVASMTDSGSEQRGQAFLNEAQNAASSAASKEYEQAKQERDAAKLKYEQPKLYAAYVVAENPDASPEAREAAAKELMKSWGYAPDERTAEKFNADKKTVAKLAAYLAQYDDAETPEEKNAAQVTLKSMGYTPDEARKMISEHRQTRAANGEYEYYKNALMNQLTYAGKAPIKHINEREQDPLYRAINNLSAGKRDYPNANFSDEAYDQENDWVNGNFSEGLPDSDVTTGEEYFANELGYLTDDERNAYNYIYETKGLQAANQYIRDGLPIRNIRAAAYDQAYAEKLVQDHPVAANLLSIASNSLANVPAMVEKLVKGTYNYMTGNNNQLFIDTNNAMHRLADMGNKIQSETSRRILEANPGTSGKIYNFTYQTGMSMAQSAVAMLAASTFGTGLTDIMFFSSAGNEAYKDAIERGGTQEQALGMAFLSGFAESFFEHASIENFLNLDYQGKGRLIKNMLSQAGVEASEEVNTELANILADALVMKDKSEYNLAVKKYMDNSMGRGLSEEAAKKKALLDQAKNVFMAGVGGLASGLGFGVFGAVPNAISQVKTGKQVKAGGFVDSYIRNAQLLGGDAAKMAQEVNDSYKVDTKGDKLKKAEPSNRLVGALAQQVNRQMLDIAGESAEKGAAVQTLLTGDKLTTNGAKTVLDALGADTLGDMGYDTSSASALAKSYNAKLEKYNVTPRMQETSNARQLAQAIPDRRNAKAAEFTGAAQEQQQSWSNADQNKVTAARADAANRVWANPTQGLSFTSEAGQTVTPMPGNMTAISFAEQERTKFQPRATATTGNVTYAVAGMQAREGLSNEQTLAEIKKGLTKEARAKANVYEKLSSALGVKMVIHDAMVGTNGFIDENGNMHVVLSGKQSVLRVAAHELTHWSKENNRAAYDSMREHLIKEVGQERFDRMLKQKAREYGIDLSTDKGKTLADDEVCAELCERMLSNEEALERFAEKDTKAAKTLKDHLVKILNAIKAAFKNASNRDFGESWSDLITEQETIESWIDMLQGAVEKAEGRAQTTEATGTKAAQTTEANDLYMDAETERKQEAKKAAEESAQKKTYVRGYTAAEVDKVLAAGVLGDKSNYEGNDYENARGMIAQLIPDVVSALKGEADLDVVNEKIKTAVGVMLDNYMEDMGDITALREAIPDVLGVDATAKGDLKHQDQSLFQMSAKLSKALGKKVTLVGPTNTQYNNAEKLEDLWSKVRDQFGLSEKDDFSVDLPKLLEYVEQQTNTRKQGEGVFGSSLQDEIDTIAGNIIDAVSEMYSQKTGERFSLDTDSLRANKEYEEKRDKLYSSLTNAREELREAEAKRKEVLESKEYNDLVESVSKAKGEDLDAAIKKYVAFMNESGANGAQRKIDSLKKDVDRLSKEFDDLVAGKQQSDREKAIEKSGLSEQDYDRKQAEKEFGYTPYYYDAGYMLPNGRLLNFSGEKGRHFGTRGQDHRAIGTIYDDSEGSEAMTRFMNGGNIRVMAETPGIDISNVLEPTREQYAKIRSFVQESAGKRFFNVDISDENGRTIGALSFEGRVSPDKVVNDIKHYFATGEIRKQSEVSKFLYSLDTDAAREAFTHIDTTAMENGLEALKGVTPGKGLWALKDVSRFMDSVAGGNKELRDNLTKIFETPHRQALKNYATGVSEMQQKVLDIGQRAGVCDAKGNHFDSKKSAAIQNIGEGFSNKRTDVSVRVVDSDAVRVTATDKETGKPLGTKDYTFRELRGAYGREVADQLWSDAFDAAQKEGKHVDVEREVNTQPYTLQDLKEAYPQDWQKLKAAADEFRTMYDDYIRNINGMLETIYPYASKYATVDKITEAIEKKQQRLADRKAAYNTQIENLQKSLEEKEKEIASKKRTDTKAYRQLVEQANRLNTQIADAKAEIAEYEANIKDELTVMGEEKALMMNAEREGDSLGRMHRLEYRSDYFHHFTEMASGIQNLKSIFTGNTDISPAVVGKSDTTKPKSRFAGFFQQRQGGSYTADALNGMLRYGQLAEYKLAFDPFAAYLRDVEKQVANLDKNATNRDNLIRYIQQWTNTILGKSHTLDRALVDSGVGMRSKLFKTLNWINSRVIQNTLLWNMRSALIQISNVTNAKSIVTNNLDWANGLRKWALARRGNSEMQSIMNQSTFLASRYMDSLELTESKLKSAKQFAGWLLGALDEVSAKATWWAAYTQYQRNPNAAVIKNAYRTYDNAIDYADDVTRRTHAGRGVGELAPAMTSRVMNLVAPFQVEVNNTYQLLKDNVKQKNYLGLLSTGISVFALNTVFEAIVGSTPLGFDFIRAIVDIAFGIAGDDPDDDDDDYSVGKAAQRLAGEFVGGLPYANQIVGIIGKDNAEKIIGSDTDVTRYGNTQIGLNALMNTVAGISDIGSAVKEGKNLFTETNFISDIDDLLNIIMPMGGKQLTRTAEGLITMAKGYSGKVDKEGSEKVQFIADNNIVNWLHAGLFGKWALTQASEYFGDERLLPKLFGAYEGPKSATGKLVDAKQYKAALDIGIDGKEFFTLKDDLKKYTTQGGKRAEMMQQKFTPEQKAKLDALLFAGSGTELKADGAVVYQKSGDEWKVKADYSNQDMFDLSKAGDKAYTGTIEAMEKTGLPQDQAALAADMWSQAKTADDSKAAFRDLLKDNKNLTVAQKEALDLQYCGNKYAADYSDPDLYELSTTNRDLYEKAKTAKKKGVSVKTYTGLYNKAKAYEGDGKAAYMRNEIMNSNLTSKQKELMDDMLVSDKGRNPDYSSKAWFEISMISESQYKKAKEGEKVGVKPETYLAAYKKRKELNAKDKNGKYINSKKKARALFKKYLDGLAITAPAHDYLWSILK